MQSYFENDNVKLYLGDTLDILKQLESNSVQCCVTSPPYWGLRNYGSEKQIGHEQLFTEYVCKLKNIFSQLKRVLKDNGTLWLNLGDSYISKPTGSLGNHTGAKYGFSENHKHQNAASDRIDKTKCGLSEKNLVGIPWRVAFALQDDNWILRQDIIWQKNAMPQSVKDRCTKSHEYLFLFAKQKDYLFKHQEIQQQIEDVNNDYNQLDLFGIDYLNVKKTRNKRDVWYIPTQPFKGSHIAPYPTKLVQPCILSGSNEGDVIIDIFNGSGTTGLVALNHNRKYIGMDINQEYLQLSIQRMHLNNKDELF